MTVWCCVVGRLRQDWGVCRGEDTEAGTFIKVRLPVVFGWWFLGRARELSS